MRSLAVMSCYLSKYYLDCAIRLRDNEIGNTLLTISFGTGWNSFRQFIRYYTRTLYFYLIYEYTKCITFLVMRWLNNCLRIMIISRDYFCSINFVHPLIALMNPALLPFKYAWIFTHSYIIGLIFVKKLNLFSISSNHSPCPDQNLLQFNLF